MKKIGLLYMLVMMIAGTAMAQMPRMFNYQGIARNNSGQPLANQPIGLKITITDITATVLYQETHSDTTNAYGLYNVVIGKGTVVSGTMASINLLMGERRIQVEIDPAGGTSYVPVGDATQLVAVPYAISSSEMLATSSGGGGLQGTSSSSLWWGFYENGFYRGYLGSYSGKNEDVDIGTGGGNTLGSMHLCIAAVPKLTVDSIGRVGIGTRFPQTDLQVKPNGTGDEINIGNQSGWTAVGMANSTGGPYNAIANGGTYLSFLYAANSGAALSSKMLMDGVGNALRPTNDNVMSLGASGYRWSAVWAANGAIQTSDERYKTNIKPLAAGLNTIMQLHPIAYSWKDENLRLGTGINYGFSAQELSKVAPDLVIHQAVTPDAETGKINSQYDDAYGVKYAELTPVLVKAIQEQQAQIRLLQDKIAALEAQLNKLPVQTSK